MMFIHVFFPVHKIFKISKFQVPFPAESFRNFIILVYTYIQYRHILLVQHLLVKSSLCDIATIWLQFRGRMNLLKVKLL